MKNLKKVLSLALAFAMVLGLCVGAMAAETQDVTKLTDWADVTQKDAAQLLNAFNIMAGDDKGNFNPAKNVTRAEAAKMITVALWGGEDLASSFTGSGDGAPLFADVKNVDWFAGYVNYAATIGIVGGRNATTFDPKGNVTGYELLKMALTALGYDQNTEGLVGANWKIKTMALAKGGNGFADLTKGVTVTSWDAPLSRDNTAKVIANMIYRTAVTYDKDGVLISRTETNTDNKTVAVSFGKYNLGLTSETGTLVANAYGAAKHKDANNADVFYTADAKKGNSVVLVGEKKTPTVVTTTSTLLDLGTPVTLYSKGGKLISVVVDGWTEVEPTYNASYAITNYVKDDDGNNAQRTIVLGGTPSTTNYSKTTYIDTNDDGNIDVETTVCYDNVEEVKAVNETKNLGTIYQTGTAAWRDSYDVKTFTNSDLKSRGFAKVDDVTAVKGDFIAYAACTNANGNIVNTGVVLTPVTGKVTRVSSNAAGAPVYHIDGDDGHTITGVNANDTTNTVGGKQIVFGADGTFYLYPNKTIGWFKGNTAKENVALLYDAGYTSTAASTALNGTAGSATLTVAAILSDGTKGTYTVVSVPDATAATKTKAANTLANVTSILGTDGYLANLNNLKPETSTIIANADQTNYLVKYVLDSDGKMIIQSKYEGSGLTHIGDTNKVIEVKSGTPTVGNYLIVPETVTFVQTKKTELTNGALTTTEDWTVALGSTAAYTIKAGAEMSAVTSKYAGSGTYKIDYAIADLSSTEPNAATASTTFYYIIKNNGQVNYVDGYPIYEVVYYDADADVVKTIQTTTNAKAGTFYTTLNSYNQFSVAWTLEAGNPENNTAKIGYVTSFANNIIGLTDVTVKDKTTQVTEKTEVKALAEERTTAYVTDKDTKFYTINGEESEKITAADVVTQGAVEPTIAKMIKENTKDTFDGQKLTVTYGAIVVVGTDNVVDTVILLEKDASASVEYKTIQAAQ